MYVGSSSRSVKGRILEHVARIRNGILEAPLTSHFIKKKHDPSSLKKFVLEQIRCNSERDKVWYLHQRETYWIDHLNTIQPAGLDEKIDFSCFL